MIESQIGNNSNSGFSTDYIGVPFLFSRDLSNNVQKVADDSFNVYVGKDFVGNKTLITQGEKIDDVSNYLHNQGFCNFTAKLDGGQYIIQPQDKDVNAIKQTLNVYLNIR